MTILTEPDYPPYIENTELFTVATAGYGPFVLNLVASMRDAGIGNHLVVYTPDNSLFEDLRSRGIRAVHIQNSDLPDWSDHQAQGFNRIVALKFEIALEILETGRNAFFIDGDIVFLRDPGDYLRDLIARSSSDMIMQYESPKGVYNTGFWFARPTPPVFGVLSEVRRRLLVDEACRCDQECFNAIWKDFGGLTLQALDLKRFACGNQFLGDLTKAVESLDQSQYPFRFDQAFILHFNYLVGKEDKINAIRKIGAVFSSALGNAEAQEKQTMPTVVRQEARASRWVRDGLRLIGLAPRKRVH